MGRLGRWAAVLGLAAVVLTGCGGDGDRETTAVGQETTAASSQESAEARSREMEKSPSGRPSRPRSLAVTLAGWKGPESAGVLTASERGHFAEVGLEVAVLVPASPLRPIQYVVDGTDDLGVSPQPQVVLAKEKGAPIVAVGSLIPEPTATMIWLESSKIQGVEDLRGKTVAISGLPFQRDLLESVLAQAGLTPEEVKIKPGGYELASMLASGRADAIFGGSEAVEGVELESRGLDLVITPVSDLGIPDYEEMVWIARSDFAAENPRLISAFLSAVRRGTAAALADPEATAKMIDTIPESNPDMSREEAEAGLETTLPLLSKTGYMDPGKAGDLVDWMLGEGFIYRKLPTSALLTNEYVR